MRTAVSGETLTKHVSLSVFEYLGDERLELHSNP
jgi:hypothetical protein